VKANRHRAAADNARDIGNWSLAIREYRKSLEFDPHQPPIWIQLGHSLKEFGDLSGGEGAYRRALELRPTDSDGALQLGHVLKVQGRQTEAIDWYRNSLLFDPQNREAARELQDVGIDPSQFLHSSVASTRRHKLDTSYGASILIEITAAWYAAQTDTTCARESLWLLDFALTLRKFEPHVLFCVFRKDDLTVSAVTDDGVEWLRQVAEGLEVPPPPESSLRSLTSRSKAFLFGIAPPSRDLERWMAGLRSLREQQDVAFVCVVPMIEFANDSEFDGADGRASTLCDHQAFREASIVLATSAEDAERGAAICRRSGREASKILLPPGLWAAKPITKAAPATPEAIVFGVLAPRRRRELLAIRDAWKGAPTASKLALIASDQNTETLAKLESIALDVGFAPADFETVPGDVASVRHLLRRCRSLLVPDSRPDGVFWVEDALALSVPVVAGLSPRLFRRFGGSVSDYCDLTDSDQLAARWIQGPIQISNTTMHIAIDKPREIHMLFEALRQTTIPEIAIGAPIIDIGVFYTFSVSSPESSERIRDGRHLLAGCNWTYASAIGTPFQHSGVFRFGLLETFYDHFRFSCLIYADPQSIIDASAETSNGEVIFQIQWTVGSAGWGWLSGDFTQSAPAGVTVRLKMAENKDPSAQVPVATVGGVFVYPATADRYWFEFLDLLSSKGISLEKES
jgi:hypothetical protein